MRIPDLTQADSGALALKGVPRLARDGHTNIAITFDLVSEVEVDDDGEPFELGGRLNTHRTAMLQAMDGGEPMVVERRPRTLGKLDIRGMIAGEPEGEPTAFDATVLRCKVHCEKATPRVEYQVRVVGTSADVKHFAELIKCDVYVDFEPVQLELSAGDDDADESADDLDVIDLNDISDAGDDARAAAK